MRVKVDKMDVKQKKKKKHVLIAEGMTLIRMLQTQMNSTFV